MTARNLVAGARSRLLLVLALCALALSGCGVMHFQTPAANATVNSPVTIEVNWTADMEPGTSPQILLDGVNIYAQPPFSSSGSRSVSGQVDMCAGAHTLEAWGNIYCWYCTGGNPYSHTGTTIQIQVPNSTGKTLSVTPANVAAGATVTGNLTLGTASSTPVSLTLSPQGGEFQVNGMPAGQSATVTVPANQTSASYTVTGVSAGSTTLRAGGAGYCTASATVQVKPALASLAPVSGASGSTITVTGQGFVPGASVRFGTVSAATQFVSATQLTATVPANLTGAQSVTVVAASQTSSALPFTVTAAPTPTPAPVVFRGSERDVQSFDFTTAGSPSLINSVSGALSPGMQVVGLAYNGAGVLLRATSGNIQAFSVNAQGQLAAGGTVAATLSPVGAALAATSSQVLRASASDLQVFGLSGTNLSLQGATGAALSSTGTGVAFATLAGRQLAVRAYSSGLEVFDITSPGAITLRGNNTSQAMLSSMGVGVYVTGNRAVRAYSGGLEVYDLSTPTPTRLAFNTQGGLSGTGVAVAADTGLNRIVRATDFGIEVYQFSGTTLTRLGGMNQALSSTGVAVAMAGNRVFRAHSGGIEEYDITTPSSIGFRGNIAATLSATGTGIAVRP